MNGNGVQHKKSDTAPKHDGDESKPPKKRTKTGCLVCRRRRIKCGEEKPVCQNCAKTKRTCEQPPVLSGKMSLSRHNKKSNQSTEHKDEDTGIGRNRHDSSSSGTWMNPSAFPLVPGENRPFILQPPDMQMQPDLYISPWEEGYSGTMISSGDVTLQPPDADEYAAAVDYCDYVPTVFDTKVSPRVRVQRLDSNYSEMSINGTSISASTKSQPHMAQPITFGPTPVSRHTSPAISLARQSDQTRSSISESPRASAMTTMNPLRPTGGLQLDETQSYYLKHFIDNVHMNFTAIIEARDPTSGMLFVRPSNFWTAVIPGMALQSAPLLHAVLAISALHEANVSNRSEHQALLDYHQSIRKLAKGLQNPGTQTREDLLATCLILAYFETMGGETVKWGRHLQGACDLARARILELFPTSDAEQQRYSSNPTIVEHLIWFHIHQDTIQALLSGNGLFLELQYIEMVPIRGEPGSITYASDQLRVFLARVGDFACKDRHRKEDNNAGLKELSDALALWSRLMTTLQNWHAQLNDCFEPLPDSSFSTPSGPAIMYSHPTIASLQMQYCGAILYLHRCHPELSPVPAEAIRMSAGTTYLLLKDIFRMMTGVMVESANNRSIDPGSHMKAMINGVLPVFLAGIALQDEEERNFIESILNDVYSMTGWRTVARVLQGLDVAWQRSGPGSTGLATFESDAEAAIRSEGAIEQRYVVIKAAEIGLNKAVGVLGKLSISDVAQHNSMDPDLIGSSHWGITNPIMPQQVSVDAHEFLDLDGLDHEFPQFS